MYQILRVGVCICLCQMHSLYEENSSDFFCTATEKSPPDAQLAFGQYLHLRSWYDLARQLDIFLFQVKHTQVAGRL